MRFFKLKASLLALIFSVLTVGLHIGTVYLVRAGVGHGMLASFWQHSLRIYWPAFDLARIWGAFGNVGPLTTVVVMVVAALLQWWLTYAAAIWLIRLYFRKPPIRRMWRFGIPLGVLAVAVLFFKLTPETLGMSKYQRFRFDVSAGNIDKVREALKHNPGYANKVQPGWGTALHEAAQSGRAEIVKLLLEKGSDVNATDGEGNTPLQVAVAWGGHENVIKILIAHRANVNSRDKDGRTPLWSAAAGGYTNIIALLLANGADVNARDRYGNCPLSGAIENNRYSVVPLLLSNGADPAIADLSGNTMLDRAALQDSPALAEMLLPYYRGPNAPTILSKAFSSAFEFGHMGVAIPIAVAALRFESNSIFEAAYRGGIEEVRSRLQSQPRLMGARDFLGLPPLHRAVQGEQIAMVHLLLSEGANINSTDQNGNTPLHWAVFMGQSNLVKTLIDHKADLNAKGAGEKTPLHLAVQQGFIPIAKMLLKAGADPNAVAAGGQTPLWVAVSNGDAAAVRLLQAFHANFNVRTRHGGNLFQAWARGTPDLEVADLLLTNGCDVNTQGFEGKTPLHVLLETIRFQRDRAGQVQAVHWLLDHKADVNAKDDKGERPLSLLQWRNRGRVIERRKDIGDLLRRYGAKD